VRLLPPLLAGAVQVTVVDAAPATATTFVGGSGKVAGITGEDDADDAPVPAAFVAATVKVYGVPLVRPVTVALVPFTVTTADGVLGEIETA
jgi:hypothetical protein